MIDAKAGWAAIQEMRHVPSPAPVPVVPVPALERFVPSQPMSWIDASSKADKLLAEFSARIGQPVPPHSGSEPVSIPFGSTVLGTPHEPSVEPFSVPFGTRREPIAVNLGKAPKEPVPELKKGLKALGKEVGLAFDPLYFVQHNLWPRAFPHWGLQQKLGYLRPVWAAYGEHNVIFDLRMAQAQGLLYQQHAVGPNKAF